MRIIVLIMMFTFCFSVDIGNVKVESYDWIKYVRSGETTKDQLDRSKEALDKLDVRYCELHDGILNRLSTENGKLFSDSEKKWKDYRNYTTYFLGSQYEGGTIKGPYMGCVMIKMTIAHIVDLVRYEEEYFRP